MNRRLRLALLLAALAAAGPSASAPPAFDSARAQVSVSWFRVNPASRPQQLKTRPAVPVAIVTLVAVDAHPDSVLPDTLRLHSLFQRPPPLRS